MLKTVPDINIKVFAPKLLELQLFTNISGVAIIIEGKTRIRFNASFLSEISKMSGDTL